MKTTVEPSSGIVKVPKDYGSFDEWEKVDEDGVGTGRRFIIVSQDDYRQNEKDLQQESDEVEEESDSEMLSDEVNNYDEMDDYDSDESDGANFAEQLEALRNAKRKNNKKRKMMCDNFVTATEDAR
ncbi:hypothetical protein OS493_001874 [Desmophyllum pertusum]|uniref:Uncharacterized protein n=1 Tax=Desmophyllum pertusum TaxID=174260 RepID=A0A9W9Z4N4_9CNID|nr:hypothetical protein OS493_001874 [Desmophyllum pertusum]